MLSETELDPFFDAVRREAFRLEALPSYAVLVESAGLAAYLATSPCRKKLRQARPSTSTSGVRSRRG